LIGGTGVVGDLELGLVRAGVMVDVDVAAAVETVVLWFGGWVGEVVVDVGEAGVIISIDQFTWPTIAGLAGKVQTYSVVSTVSPGAAGMLSASNGLSQWQSLRQAQCVAYSSIQQGVNVT